MGDRVRVELVVTEGGKEQRYPVSPRWGVACLLGTRHQDVIEAMSLREMRAHQMTAKPRALLRMWLQLSARVALLPIAVSSAVLADQQQKDGAV